MLCIYYIIRVFNSEKDTDGRLEKFNKLRDGSETSSEIIKYKIINRYNNSRYLEEVSRRFVKKHILP